MATTTAVKTRATPWRGDDFPSWLSPMLVKELRQGIQSGQFAWTFVTLHLGMLVLMGLWVANVGANPADARTEGEWYRGIFWFIVALATVVVLPLRGLQAIKAEETGQTFDLLRLTRLTSTQIVTGKWVAIVAQVALLACALLPYLVLQYFLGGYGVADDLALIAALVVAAGVIAAGALACSNQPRWVRVVAAIGVTTVAMYGAVGAGMLPGMGSLGMTASLFGGMVAGAGVLVMTLLEVTAAAIAPRAENHALRKRVLALGLIGVVGAAGWVAAGRVLPFTGVLGALVAVVPVALPAAVLLLVTELLTDAVPLRVIHEPFARLGLTGRCLAALFTPGWATAVPLALLAAAAITLAAVAAASGDEALRQRMLVSAVMMTCVLLSPVPLTRLVKAGPLRPLVYVIAVFASLIPLLSQGSRWPGIRSVTTEILEALVAVLPLPALLRFWGDTPRLPSLDALLGPVIVTACLWSPLVPAWLAEMAALGRRLAECGGPGGRQARP